MPKIFRALNGQEIREVFLEWLDQQLNTVDHPKVTSAAKKSIHATVERMLDGYAQLGMWLTYPVLRLDQRIELNPDVARSDDRWPFKVVFDMETPQNEPKTLTIETTGMVSPMIASAAPIQVTPPARPADARKVDEITPGTGITAGENADTTYRREQTAAGLELKGGLDEEPPLGVGKAPTIEEQMAIEREQAELARNNERLLRQSRPTESGTIVLTDSLDVIKPDEVRRQANIPVPAARTVKIGPGMTQTVEEPLGQGITAPASEVEETL